MWVLLFISSHKSILTVREFPYSESLLGVMVIKLLGMSTKISLPLGNDYSGYAIANNSFGTSNQVGLF